tara:strand:+ start:97 stop:354 length:258 start_codon:yes stop_codon:yes gene_type:complete
MGDKKPIPIDSWNDATKLDLEANPLLTPQSAVLAKQKNLEFCVSSRQIDVLAEILWTLRVNHIENEEIKLSLEEMKELMKKSNKN